MNEQDSRAKKCTKCAEVKPLTEFSSHIRAADSLQCRCKRCMSRNPSVFDAHVAAAKNGLKYCTQCRELKPESDFQKTQTRASGRLASCKQCFASKKRGYSQIMDGFRTCTKCKNRQSSAEYRLLSSGYRSVICNHCRIRPVDACRNGFTPNSSRVDGDVAYIVMTSKTGAVVAEAMIDVADLPRVLSAARWSAHRSLNTTYAEFNRGKLGRCSLHRFIMQPPSDMVVDHINGDGTDNRKANLRIVTQAENLRNTRRHRAKAANSLKAAGLDTE